jgi:hypothetical protein
MKKLIIGVGVLLTCLLVESFRNIYENSQRTKLTTLKKNSTGKSELPIEISLNGYSIYDADNMVYRFDYGRIKNDNSKTNVWFSKGLIHNIFTLLSNENADGIRIYFASETAGNNIILVSTRDGGGNSSAASGKNHLDYFEHTAVFLSTAQSNGDIKVDHGSPGSGALLYNTSSPCSGQDCSILPEHDLKCDTAYCWVNNYSLDVNDTTNTKSEWFDLKLIGKLDTELQKGTGLNSPDGLRIYFAKNKKYQKLTLIMVTTKTVDGVPHTDYYECFKPKKGVTDNGEQCPNNCKGTVLP